MTTYQCTLQLHDKARYSTVLVRSGWDMQQGKMLHSHPNQTFSEASCVEVSVSGRFTRTDIENTAVECLLTMTHC